MAACLVPDELLALLRRVDTPTVCNAIEVCQGKRGFDRFTRGTMQYSNPDALPLVGFARTAKIAGLQPSKAPPTAVRAQRLDYFRAMATGPRPAVAVVEDMDFPDSIAGWWGEVHAAVHNGLGLAGAVTNGVMRDLDAMDKGFAVLAGSIGVSHFHVHVREVGTPVNIFGLLVAEGDLIHADRHGALVIPDEVVDNLGAAITTVTNNEAIVLEPARQPDFDIDKLEQAWEKFEAART